VAVQVALAAVSSEALVVVVVLSLNEFLLRLVKCGASLLGRQVQVETELQGTSPQPRGLLPLGAVAVVPVETWEAVVLRVAVVQMPQRQARVMAAHRDTPVVGIQEVGPVEQLREAPRSTALDSPHGLEHLDKEEPPAAVRPAPIQETVEAQLLMVGPVSYGWVLQDESICSD
jgi:hypothetical protein